MDFLKTKFTLAHQDATQIKYHLEILSNGTWYGYNTSFIHMVGNPDKKTVTPKENPTPGFEFLLIISSILFVLSLIQIKKKVL